jgi:hypothetical protein
MRLTRRRCPIGAVEASITPELCPTSPDERMTAIVIAPAIANPAIPFAAKRSRAADLAGHRVVANEIAGPRGGDGRKRSCGPRRPYARAWI